MQSSLSFWRGGGGMSQPDAENVAAYREKPRLLHLLWKEFLSWRTSKIGSWRSCTVVATCCTFVERSRFVSFEPLWSLGLCKIFMAIDGKTEPGKPRPSAIPLHIVTRLCFEAKLGVRFNSGLCGAKLYKMDTKCNCRPVSWRPSGDARNRGTISNSQKKHVWVPIRPRKAQEGTWTFVVLFSFFSESDIDVAHIRVCCWKSRGILHGSTMQSISFWHYLPRPLRLELLEYVQHSLRIANNPSQPLILCDSKSGRSHFQRAPEWSKGPRVLVFFRLEFGTLHVLKLLDCWIPEHNSKQIWNTFWLDSWLCPCWGCAWCSWFA